MANFPPSKAEVEEQTKLEAGRKTEINRNNRKWNRKIPDSTSPPNFMFFLLKKKKKKERKKEGWGRRKGRRKAEREGGRKEGKEGGSPSSSCLGGEILSMTQAQLCCLQPQMPPLLSLEGPTPTQKLLFPQGLEPVFTSVTKAGSDSSRHQARLPCCC